MNPDPAHQDGWRLGAATTAVVDELMDWFPDKSAVDIWGGPRFRYPYTRESFIEDCLWDRMRAFGLYDPAGNLAAFGQLVERYGRVHMARLVVKSAYRGQGIGKRLIKRLLTAGQTLFANDEAGLFVYRHNTRALMCYESMGFTISEYPEDAPMPEQCYYLTRAVSDTSKQQQGENDDT